MFMITRILIMKAILSTLKQLKNMQKYWDPLGKEFHSAIIVQRLKVLVCITISPVFKINYEKRRLEDSNDNKDSNVNKDNNKNKDNNDYIEENTFIDDPYLQGNDTISDFKNRTMTYINKIYDKLKNIQQKCIPLASVNPAKV